MPNQPTNKVYDPDDQEPVIAPKLGVVEGGGQGDGIPRGNLRAIDNEGLDNRESAGVGTDSTGAEEKSGLFRGNKSGTHTPSIGKEMFDATDNFLPPSARVAKFLGSKFTKKNSVIGGIIGTIMGVVILAFSIFQGPMEFVHLSKVLGSNFSDQENSSDIRARGLYRYAKSGRVGETKLTYFESKVLYPRIEKRLSAIGIEINQSKLAGQTTTMTIDTSKHPEYKNLSNKEARAKIAKDYGQDPSKVGQINGGADGKTGGKFAFNVRGEDISSQRAVLGVASGQTDVGKISGGIQFRVLGKYYNTPSWLHPLKRLGAAGDKRLEAALEKKSKRYKERREAKKKAIKARSAEAQARAESFKSKFKIGSGVVGGVLLGQTAVCVAYDAADELPQINRENVVIPGIKSGVELIGAGHQIMARFAGQDSDVTLEELGEIKKEFKDKNGKTIHQARSIKAYKGGAGGEDIDPEIKGAFTNTKSAEMKKDLEKDFGAKGLCSTAGKTISTVAGVGLLFIPGVGWATKAISAGAGMAAITVVSALLPKLLADDGLEGWTPHQGPLGGNIDMYSMREAGNTSFRASGARELSKNEEMALRRLNQDEEKSNIARSSFRERVFALNGTSLVSQIFMPPSTNNFSFSTLATTNLFSAQSKLITKPVSAAETEYDFGFPKYGFSVAELKEFEDPYENAENVAKILDSSSGNDYIDRASRCFGVDITKGEDGWNVIAEQEVNAGTKEYGEANCADKDKTWQSIRMFVFDTRNMAAISCFEGDDEACSEVTGGTQASDSSSETVDDADFEIKKLKPGMHTPGGKVSPVQGITLHWWGSQYGNGIRPLVDALRSNPSCGSGGCSVQLGITSDGEVYQMTKNLNDLTYHAIGANKTTIGIEIEGGPKEFGRDGKTKYPEKFDAVVKTVKYLMKKYDIPIEGVMKCGDVEGIHPHKAYNSCPGAGGKDDIDDYYFDEVIKRVKE